MVEFDSMTQAPDSFETIQTVWLFRTHYYAKISPDAAAVEAQFVADLDLINARINAHSTLGHAAGVTTALITEASDTGQDWDVPGGRYRLWGVVVSVTEETSVSYAD